MSTADTDIVWRDFPPKDSQILRKNPKLSLRKRICGKITENYQTKQFSGRYCKKEKRQDRESIQV